VIEVSTSSTATSAVGQPAEAAAHSWEMHTSPGAQCSKTLLILGEAPGAEEEAAGVPFIGSAGRQLTEAFQSAGLDRAEWHILNTFLKRPPSNDLADSSWTLNKTEFKREYGYVPSTPPLKKRYLRPEHQWQIAELQERLRILKPDLILAMGATALWALTGHDAITQYRGAFFRSRFGMAIATLHPASILYQYANMPFLWSDLVKVRLWLAGELPAPMRRRLWIDPTFAEIAAYYRRLLAAPNELVGVDIETAPAIDQITTISFSTASEGICIPLWDRYGTVEAHNVYDSAATEVAAWRWIERFARLPNPKVMQNGMYDAQYLLDAPIPLRLKNWRDDTVLVQHSYQPELKKDLGTLASLYLNEPSWKQMRQSAKDAKADE
jgi:uracil-DNA glycosylase